MKETAELKVEKRTHSSTSANKRLRKEGFLPGNIYGKGTESIAVAVKKNELRKKINHFGRHAIFTLKMAGEKKPYSVIIKEIQNSPMMDEELHVDFQQISLSEEIKADVMLKVINTEAIESQKLIITSQMDSINVKGLPQDIPDTIDIDASELQVNSIVTIADLKLPKGITCENEPDHIVVTINPSKLKVSEVTEEDEEPTIF